MLFENTAVFFQAKTAGTTQQDTPAVRYSYTPQNSKKLRSAASLFFLFDLIIILDGASLFPIHLDLPNNAACPEFAVDIGVGTHQALLAEIHSVFSAQILCLNVGVIGASHGSGLPHTPTDTFQQLQRRFIDYAIEDLIAFTPRLDHAVAAENPELVTGKGLGFARGFHYLVYGLLSVLQKVDDPKAHGM